MPRTKFPDYPVNKPINLANINSININNIESKFTLSIDRIQLSIDSRCYFSCKKSFEYAFKRYSNQRPEDRRIRQYTIHNTKVQLVKYLSGKPYSGMWFSVSIQDPTPNALEAIKCIIEKALKDSNLTLDRASLSQAEFAADFSAQKVEEQSELFDLMSRSVVLKYARPTSYRKINTTTYLGKEGNVRKGTKGLRCYPKVVNGHNCYRIELQVNRLFIKNKKITIDNIVDFYNNFNPFNYFSFYDNIKISKSYYISDRIITRKRPDLLNSSKLAQRVFICAIRNKVLNGIFEDGNISMHESSLPVAKQMDYIKEIHLQYGLTYHKDRLFTRLVVR